MFMGFLIFAARAIATPETEVVDVDALLGTDGLSMRDTFIPAQAIERIDVGEASCRVVYGRQALELHGTPTELEVARSVVASIKAYAFTRDDAGERYLLELQHTGATSRAPAGYRELSFDVERTLCVAEDPRVAPETRIRAARVLHGHADPATRVRIAEAAEACAHPGVRAALRESVDAIASEGAIPASDSAGAGR